MNKNTQFDFSTQRSKTVFCGIKYKLDVQKTMYSPNERFKSGK